MNTKEKFSVKISVKKKLLKPWYIACVFFPKSELNLSSETVSDSVYKFFILSLTIVVSVFILRVCDKHTLIGVFVIQTSTFANSQYFLLYLF